MVMRIIQYGNRFYYLYDTYNTWQAAANVGMHFKRRNRKLHWYIIKGESGTVFPATKYHLYMDKVRRANIW